MKRPVSAARTAASAYPELSETLLAGASSPSLVGPGWYRQTDLDFAGGSRIEWLSVHPSIWNGGCYHTYFAWLVGALLRSLQVSDRSAQSKANAADDDEVLYVPAERAIRRRNRYCQPGRKTASRRYTQRPRLFTDALNVICQEHGGHS